MGRGNSKHICPAFRTALIGLPRHVLLLDVCFRCVSVDPTELSKPSYRLCPVIILCRFLRLISVTYNECLFVSPAECFQGIVCGVP